MVSKQTEGTIPLEGHVTQPCVQRPDALHVNVTACVTPTDIQIGKDLRSALGLTHVSTSHEEISERRWNKVQQ